MVSRQIPAESDVHSDEVHQHHPPPPAYSAIATAPAPSNPGNRPELPVRVRNPQLQFPATLHDPDALVVKFQTIVRDGKEIVVGRLKVATNLPAPNEHAFVLRRYDTGAISVTTMFKAAFPGATDEEEEREMRWIKSMFDMTGMNGGRDGATVKLAGNWIPPTTAESLAGAYRMGEWIEAMVAAEPVKGVAYRKSQRSQQAYEQANKKQEQKETVATDAPAPTGTTSLRTGSTATAAPSNSSTRRSGTTPDLTNTPPRSTAPASTAEPVAKRARRAARAAAEGSSETRSTGPSHDARGAVISAEGTPIPETQETVGFTLESTREIRAPAGTIIDAEAQIAQSKADVLRLKAEAEARAAAGESPAEMGLIGSSSTSSATLIDAASPEGSRGTKRTAARQAADEATEITGSTVVLPGSVAEAVVRRRQGRVVQPEEARRRGAVMGALMFGVGAVGAWAWQNLL